MTKEEIRALRDKIGTDPILTDEEIEYIWMAMDKAVDEESELNPHKRQVLRNCVLPEVGKHILDNAAFLIEMENRD